MEELGALVGPEQLEAIVAAVSRFGLQIIAAIVVFIVGRWPARRLTNLLERGMTRAGTDPALIGLFRNIMYFDLQEAMKKRFDEEGISIPFPQRDVHLFQQAS